MTEVGTRRTGAQRIEGTFGESDHSQNEVQCRIYPLRAHACVALLCAAAREAGEAEAGPGVDGRWGHDMFYRHVAGGEPQGAPGSRGNKSRGRGHRR